MQVDWYEVTFPNGPPFEIAREDFCRALGLNYPLVCAAEDAEHYLHALLFDQANSMVLLSQVVGKDPTTLRRAARQLDQLGIRNEVRGRRRWVNISDCLRARLGRPNRLLKEMGISEAEVRAFLAAQQAENEAVQANARAKHMR
jgi:hypothetical protein